MKQKRKRRVKSRRFRLIKGNAGSFYLTIISLAIGLAFILMLGERNSMSQPQVDRVVTSGYSCCDTGDGEACKPRTDKTLVFRGSNYGLLKSNFIPYEGNEHLEPAVAEDGTKVFFNSGDDDRAGSEDSHKGCPDSDDWVVDIDPSGRRQCIAIPDEQLIYTCREDNEPGQCDGEMGEARMDAYWRVDGFEIPDKIRNCNKPTGGPVAGGYTGQTIVTKPQPDAKDNLQLETFTVENYATAAAKFGWISPWCKPAIYLYPPQMMSVNVQVHPVGRMTVTIPKYPAHGWNVLAYPNGQLVFGNDYYDYLYYEAEIPDDKIVKPYEGYVASYAALGETLTKVLSELGLSANERNDFIDYWLRVLPSVPYYKIKVIPQENLQTLAPLVISPKPQTVIRVALFFEPLEQFEEIAEPSLSSLTRTGFTVVEWGGFFKRDAEHAFSCFM